MSHHTTALSIWADESKVELLRKLRAEGVSFLRIAEEIGCTRNAVIGKASRLGLAKPLRASRPPRAPRAPRVRVRNRGQAGFEISKPRIDPEPFIPLEEIEIPAHQRKDLQQLTDETCRWPVGDPQTEEFYFCGGVVGPDKCKPYCKAHARIAYAKPVPGKTGRPRPDLRFMFRKNVPAAEMLAHLDDVAEEEAASAPAPVAEAAAA